MFGFSVILKKYLETYKVSQKEFADSVGISVKHLNNLLNGKVPFTTEVILAISLVTNIDTDLIIFAENKKRIVNEVNSTFKTKAKLKEELDSYHIFESEKRNWLTLKNKDDIYQCAYDLLSFLEKSSFNALNNFKDNRIYFKKREGAPINGVFMWLNYCEKKALTEEVSDYNSKNINKLLQELKVIVNQPFNENNLIKLFNKYGIYLVIEDGLKGMKTRGACKVLRNNPGIFMTKYLHNAASFYFTLYHELGHIKTDFCKAKANYFVDESDPEEKMDAFALNCMIPDSIWNDILKTREYDKIAKYYNIPLSFIYSRLAYEDNKYYKDKNYLKYKEII